MCGILGLFAHDLSREERERLVDRMGATIRHRGPDSSGVWSADGDGQRTSSVPFTLGHRRLALIDLTPSGHQPMQSRSNRYSLSFNGEIYNYKEILLELASTGFEMRGTSDTEVVLGAFEAWGIESAVRRFVGMFALAVWDREQRSVVLLRDRFGEKPLYYGVVNRRFVFASELRPFREPSAGALTISRDALAMFARYNCIPAPFSIFEQILKLPPGHMLRVPLDQPIAALASLPTPQMYYDIGAIACAAYQDRFKGTRREAVDEVSRLLQRSVAHQMVADVPVGAFLSGGIDSSMVVSIMQSLSSRPIKTFSIGFGEGEYNEAPFAAEVARHLGTDHTELLLTSADALAVVPNLAQHFDEPFADSSQIPTLLVSKLARQQVTVSLSGDGGDELFGGYERYRWTERIWNVIRHVPRPVRHTIGYAISRLPMTLMARVGGLFQRVNPSLSGFHSPGDKLLRLAALLGSANVRELYHQLLSHWSEIGLLVPGAQRDSNFLLGGRLPINMAGSDKDWMMLYDLLTYLPDDILTKVDRASMAVSLESRIPMLDHRLAEFALTLPQDMKFSGGATKWVLREVLKRHMPERLFARPKRGFSIPLGDWLAGPLREWARELLEPLEMETLGYLNPIAVQAAWEQHVSGARPRHNELWIVLMFCAWHRAFFDSQGPG